MRRARVPAPHAAWGLSCEGPASPPAASQQAARERLETALAAVPGLDVVADGWTVIWRGPVVEEGHRLGVTFWVDRFTRARALAESIARSLDAAGFTASVGAGPAAPTRSARERAVYARSGMRRVGLDFHDTVINGIEVVEEPRAGVDLFILVPLPVRRCPSCKAEDRPARLVFGFPDEDLLAAAQRGEVVLGGCLVNPRARINAACRHCGRRFVVR